MEEDERVLVVDLRNLQMRQNQGDGSMRRLRSFAEDIRIRMEREKRAEHAREQLQHGNDLTPPTVKLEELYICAVDPRSEKTFQINLGTQEAKEVVLATNKQIPNKIKRE